MNLDDFKQPWQQRQRDLDGRVDHVIKKVRSRMAGFDRTIWFRDMQESVAAVLLIIWYTYQLLQPQNFMAKCSLVLGILGCIAVVAVFYWARKKGKVAHADLPVEDFCKAELERVNRQIWLLRNIHWWYLMPLFIPIIFLLASNMATLQVLILTLTFLLPFGGFVYWLNQVGVRDQLLPLKHALTQARDDDDDSDSVEDHDTITPLEPLKINRRRVFLVAIAVAALIAAGGFLADQFGVSDRAPKVSPFTEVQFEQQQVIVTYQQRKYQWIELDGIRVQDIVAAAQTRFWGSWQKRVSEDLVDVLWKMDHQPGDTVSLLLRDLETGEQKLVEQAPMTKKNRFAVCQNRRNDEIEAKAYQDSVHLSEDELKELPIDQTLRDRLVGRYQISPDFIFDVKDHDGRLMVGITNQQTQEVFPDSANRWSYQSVEAMLEFKLGPEGPAKRVILHQNGYRQSAIRIYE